MALGVPAGAAAQNDLPTGFGGIELGQNWSEVEEQHEFRLLDEVASPFDLHVRECGYRSAVLPTDNGELMLTANDFVITDMAYMAAIKPDSDLLAVADLVMQNYGQPHRAAMRNRFGRVTIDKDDVSYITLEYSQPAFAEFTISGAGIWQYRIRLRSDDYRWHENKTLRCARTREKTAREEAAAQAAPEPEPAPAQ